MKEVAAHPAPPPPDERVQRAYSLGKGAESSLTQLPSQWKAKSLKCK